MTSGRRRHPALGLLLGGALFAVAHVAAGQPAGYSVFQLVSPEVHDAEFFGRSVASLGPDLVIGAPGWVADGTQPGRVYVMSPMGNVRLTIENPTPAGGDEFGAAVAVVGANILVGAPFDDTAGPDTGAAYLFDGATGVLLQTFLVPGAVPNAQCARAVAALGGDALVGCDGAYLFDAGTALVIRHYTAPGCNFSTGLATIGGDVLVGSNGSQVCRFDGPTATLAQTYVDPESNGGFGHAIAAASGQVLVGTPSLAAREKAFAYDAAMGGLLNTFTSPFTLPPYVEAFGESVAGGGAYVAIGSQYSVHFFDAATYAFVARYLPGDPINDSPRGDVTTVFGDSFTLWTDTIRPNTGRGAVDLLDRCGNGVPSPAEQCDDGNVADGDGCSALCHLELCPPDPRAAGCRDLTPGASSKVLLQSRSMGPWAINSDRLAWKWRGAATTLTEFGDPATTSYQLCIYDNLFVTPTLRMDFALPAEGTCGGLPCWQTESSRLRYVDPAGTPSGIVHAKLMAGADGHATIALTGQGRLLAAPAPVPPSSGLPFNFGLGLVLRNNTTGVCWAAGYGAIRNTHGTLRGFTRGT